MIANLHNSSASYHNEPRSLSPVILGIGMTNKSVSVSAVSLSKNSYDTSAVIEGAGREQE